MAGSSPGSAGWPDGRGKMPARQPAGRRRYENDPTIRGGKFKMSQHGPPFIALIFDPNMVI
jgi:hypothetical protein